jgi:hypothetical protein
MQPHKTREDHEGGSRFWRRLRCSMRSGHDPVHHPLGGFRCSRCGQFGATLEQLGFEDEGYVSEKERRRLATGGGSANRAA